MKRILLAMAAAMAGLAGAAEPAEPAVPLGGPHVYKKAGDRELRLFVLEPEGAKPAAPRPAIVFFHGGGWVRGSPAQFNEPSRHFVARGLVCVQVEYRLLNELGKDALPLPCVQDAKSAMRWVRANAARFGIDPKRIASAGGSAGGHLAAFVGMVGGLDDPQDDLSVSPRSNAMLLFNPVLHNGPGREGWQHARVGDRYREFSPFHNVSADDPPAIFFLGAEDHLIPVKVAHDFEAAMTKAGVRCETRIYEGQPHGFYKADQSAEYCAKTTREADRFLVSLGWLAGEPAAKAP